MNTREVTHQYRLNQWMGIIRECRSSGQTVSVWCASHNVNPKSYYYWLKRVRLAACESLPVLSSDQQIVPLNIPAHPTRTDSQTPEPCTAITLRVGSVTVELHNGASITLIENTLKSLQHVR